MSNDERSSNAQNKEEVLGMVFVIRISSFLRHLSFVICHPFKSSRHDAGASEHKHSRPIAGGDSVRVCFHLS